VDWNDWDDPVEPELMLPVWLELDEEPVAVERPDEVVPEDKELLAGWVEDM
jgi:hypothetical protein